MYTYIMYTLIYIYIYMYIVSFLHVCELPGAIAEDTPLSGGRGRESPVLGEGGHPAQTCSAVCAAVEGAIYPNRAEPGRFAYSHPDVPAYIPTYIWFVL